MFTLRNEVVSCVQACERLISSATMQGNPQLTVEECEIIEYYAGKLLKLAQASTFDGLQQLDMLSALAHHESGAATPSTRQTSP